MNECSYDLFVVYIGNHYCVSVDCLSEHSIDLFDFHTGTLAALAHYLSFALLVVGIPLR